MDPIRDFRGDSTGDLAVVNGDFAVIAGEEAIPQGIQTRVLMFKKDSFLDESVGVDWIDEILIKNPDPSVVRALISEAIGATPDVIRVQGAQLTTLAGRAAKIDYQATTTYSAEPLAGQVETP